MTDITIRGKNPGPWAWITLIILILSVTNCVSTDIEAKAKKEEREALDLKNWQNSPEHAFRFCITTAAGNNGTATPEQIAACNKAAGR